MSQGKGKRCFILQLDAGLLISPHTTQVDLLTVMSVYLSLLKYYSAIKFSWLFETVCFAITTWFVQFIP